MKTRTITLIWSLFLILAAAAHARLGETYEECVTRYGAPTEKLPKQPDEMPGVEIYRFNKAQWGISITFWKGKAYELVYYKANRKSPDILPEEIATIRDLSVPNAKWVAEGNNWSVELPNISDIAAVAYTKNGPGVVVMLLSYEVATKQYLKKNMKGL